MPRKHMFMILALLAAALAAGALAVTRTTDLGSSANASTSPDAAITFRLKKLDRFEAALQKQLVARGSAPRSAGEITVYRRASASPVSSYHEREDGYGADVSENEGRDD